MMKSIFLFSDGSCLGNPGVGGWAYILKYNKIVKKDSGACKNTTNNQMELLAIIKGLSALKRPCNVEIYTDSKYVANSINLWLDGWIKKEFKNVKNVDLWMEYLAVAKVHKIKAFWIKAHAGHPENEECDKMARDKANELKKEIMC